MRTALCLPCWDLKMASEIARLYNSGFCDDDRDELAALLEEYMGEEDSERSGSDSEVDDSIVSSDEEADFDLRQNDFDAAMVHANGAVDIVVDTREEELRKATTSSTYWYY